MVIHSRLLSSHLPQSTKNNICYSTSPSVYISIIGAVTVSDFCGIVGPVPTNPVVPITGQLSTASYYYKLGKIWQSEAHGKSGTTKWLDFADFANPTWGLSNEFLTSYIDPSNNRPTVTKVRTIGPLFNPIVVPPSELLSHESAWSVISKEITSTLHYHTVSSTLHVRCLL